MQFAFDAVHDAARFVNAAVDHQPSRRFRNPHANDEDDEPERRADEERAAPSDVGRQQRRIEQHDRSPGAERCADPEAAVDDEVGPAAIARRHQFLDGRIDGGIFAADARSGEEAKYAKARDAPRQRGRGGGDEVDRERDEEQLLAPEPVREPAEIERAKHRADKIGAAGEADLGIAEMEHGARLERARHGAGERHFEPVENPGDAEADHHAGVKAAPREPVEPRRDVGLDKRRCRVSRFSRCNRQYHPLLPAQGKRSQPCSVPRNAFTSP